MTSLIDFDNINAGAPEQRRAYSDLNGDGGLASWERVIRGALPEN